MGLYFVTPGAGVRATDVLYDRARFAFAEAAADAWDWTAILDRADRLHLSGITPALGAASADAALLAARAATRAGVPVSFDGNFRASLWARRAVDPRTILHALIAEADVLSGDRRDIALVLGRGFTDPREASEAAFETFPKLRLIASTLRTVEQVDRHRLSARVDTPASAAETEAVELAGIVDRIGGGDAFVAGALHAEHSSGDPHAMARTGLALAALKHSLPGDASLFRHPDLERFMDGNRDVRR